YEIDTFIDGSILTVADAPWPGFTPDLLSIVLVTAIQARGNVLIHQKMFESRLLFVDMLIAMAARITLCDPHRANVIGLNNQTKFESRLFFVDKLIDMGAQIISCDPHRATVIGLNNQTKLRGIEMTSPDIRAGVSLLIAALSAQGKSVIYNIEQIERGYQDIEERLKALGADIRRIEAIPSH